MSFVSQDGIEPAAFRPMLQIDMGIRDFSAHWSHCDYISGYVARMISHNRADSVLYSNLFSSALNELLEIAFRARHTDGRLHCKVWRNGAVERVEMTLPCAPSERHFLEQAIARLKDNDATERYLDALSAEIAPTRDAVLLELAIDYNATLSIISIDDHAITLIVDLPLEGLPLEGPGN
jgi:hypothetical protein